MESITHKQPITTKNKLTSLNINLLKIILKYLSLNCLIKISNINKRLFEIIFPKNTFTILKYLFFVQHNSTFKLKDICYAEIILKKYLFSDYKYEQDLILLAYSYFMTTFDNKEIKLNCNQIIYHEKLPLKDYTYNVEELNSITQHWINEQQLSSPLFNSTLSFLSNINKIAVNADDSLLELLIKYEIKLNIKCDIAYKDFNNLLNYCLKYNNTLEHIILTCSDYSKVTEQEHSKFLQLFHLNDKSLKSVILYNRLPDNLLNDIFSIIINNDNDNNNKSRIEIGFGYYVVPQLSKITNKQFTLSNCKINRLSIRTSREASLQDQLEDLFKLNLQHIERLNILLNDCHSNVINKLFFNLPCLKQIKYFKLDCDYHDYTNIATNIVNQCINLQTLYLSVYRPGLNFNFINTESTEKDENNDNLKLEILEYNHFDKEHRQNYQIFLPLINNNNSNMSKNKKKRKIDFTCSTYELLKYFFEVIDNNNNNNGDDENKISKRIESITINNSINIFVDINLKSNFTSLSSLHCNLFDYSKISPFIKFNNKINQISFCKMDTSLDINLLTNFKLIFIKNDENNIFMKYISDKFWHFKHLSYLSVESVYSCYSQETLYFKEQQQHNNFINSNSNNSLITTNKLVQRLIDAINKSDKNKTLQLVYLNLIVKVKDNNNNEENKTITLDTILNQIK